MYQQQRFLKKTEMMTLEGDPSSYYLTLLISVFMV